MLAYLMVILALLLCTVIRSNRPKNIAQARVRWMHKIEKEKSKARRKMTRGRLIEGNIDFVIPDLDLMYQKKRGRKYHVRMMNEGPITVRSKRWFIYWGKIDRYLHLTGSIKNVRKFVGTRSGRLACAGLVVCAMSCTLLKEQAGLFTGLPFAMGALKQWSPTSGNLASTDANWVGGVEPVAGDDISFDHAISDGNCTWDLAITVGTFTLGTGYLGSVIQSVDFGCTDFLIQSGVCNSGAFLITCSANYTRTGGSGLTSVDMTGNNKVISGNTDFGLATLKIRQNVTIQGASTYVSVLAGFYNYGTLNLVKKLWLIPDTVAGVVYSNSGTIIGTGTLEYRTSIDRTISFGDVRVPVIVSLKSGASASRTVALGASATLGSSLTVLSYDAVKTATLDISGYSLTCAPLTVGVRGILLGGEGAITVNGGAFNSSAGTFTEETCTTIFTGASTVKLAAGQKFYNLITRARAWVTMLSDMTVENELVRCADNIMPGAYAITMTDPGKLYDRHRIHHENNNAGYLTPEPGDLILRHLEVAEG